MQVNFTPKLSVKFTLNFWVLLNSTRFFFFNITTNFVQSTHFIGAFKQSNEIHNKSDEHNPAFADGMLSLSSAERDSLKDTRLIVGMARCVIVCGIASRCGVWRPYLATKLQSTATRKQTNQNVFRSVNRDYIFICPIE